jgi:hypothetical protein
VTPITLWRECKKLRDPSPDECLSGQGQRQAVLVAPGRSRDSSHARRIQVGAALGRHFPTREHLLAELYRHELTQLVDAVAPLLAEHPPLRALTCWMQRLVEYARVKRGVMAAIEASTWRDLYSGQHHRLDEALGALLDRGKAVGQVREEVDATDVILLLGALSRIPRPEWDARAHTIVAVIVDGLRPVENPACTGEAR